MRRRKERMNELRLRMNEARKLNNRAVIEENERNTDPLFDRRRKRAEWLQDQKDAFDDLKRKGLSKTYMNETALKSSKGKRRDKGRTTFGWDGKIWSHLLTSAVFNDDALYRAYHKRVKNMPVD